MSGKKKVLVVDDQKDIVETIAFCLEQEGYEVVTAFDGEQALERARAEDPDLIILDVMLPKENGYQVARYLREDAQAGRVPRRPPIIVLTARTVEEKEREEFLQTWTGADEFMYKPFDLEVLLQRVTEILASSTAAS